MMLHKTCLRCNRKLKTLESQQLGFGKICWEKYNNENKYKELFPAADCLTKSGSEPAGEVDSNAFEQ